MRFVALVFVTALSLPVQAQLRIVTWNTAGEPRTGTETVLEAIGNESVNGIAKPIDALLLQEQNSVAGDTQDFVDLLNGLYGAGTYASGTVNADTTGAGRVTIVYNTATLDLIAETPIGTAIGAGAARQVMRYTLRPDGYDASAEFYIYNSHYKASTGSTNEARRLVEATAIRSDADALGQGASAIYLGDFNMRDSDEDAYQHLLSAGNGQALDPINRPGDWHNDAAFLDVHTQSPVTSSRFSGQITGGMDDRFDQQLVTGELLDAEGLDYITGSYRAFGNNGTHSFNGEITSGTGASTSVLNALANASDHLPVVVDYQVPAVLSAAIDPPPPIVPQDKIIKLTVSILNDADAVSANGVDELDYTYTTSGSVSGFGQGSIAFRNGVAKWSAMLDTTGLGAKAGSVSVTTSSQGAAGTELFELIEYTVALPGDADLDGDVDDSDLGLAISSFTGPGATGNAWGNGDFDLEGDVDDSDLGIAIANFTGPLAPASVPEPASLALLTIAGLFLSHRRR